MIRQVGGWLFSLRGKAAVRKIVFSMVTLCLWHKGTVRCEAADLVIFDGPARSLPMKAGFLDLKALTNPQYIRIVGCGGGGGGAGAGRAANIDDGLGPSGSGGAGADMVNIAFGPLGPKNRLPIHFENDGQGGCGGSQDRNGCQTLGTNLKLAPAVGQPGHKGVTVIIGEARFEGGDGGSVIPNWAWTPTTRAPASAVGGQHAIPGGNGGTFKAGGPTEGRGTSEHPGGKVGPQNIGPGGHGGIPGAGGGASNRGSGGTGGRAGSGDGKPTGSNNDAGPGEIGQACAGGGGGGAAAGGTFPGGNGGNGGEPWLTIYKLDVASGANGQRGR